MFFKFSQGGILIVHEPLSTGKLGNIVQGMFSSNVCIRHWRTKSMICSQCGEAPYVKLLASSAGRAHPPACAAVGHLVPCFPHLLLPLPPLFSLHLPATHPEMLTVLSFLSLCSRQRVAGPLPGFAQLVFLDCLHAWSHLVAGVAPS